MGRCYSRLSHGNKATLKKLTNNFYCLIRKRESWTKSQISFLRETINYKILNPIPLGFCHQAIFGIYDIETNTHIKSPKMILFNYDTLQGKKHSLRGIASISYDTEEKKKYMKINVIGNISLRNKPSAMAKERHNIETKSGKDMISYLKKYAKKSKVSYIKLYSMEQVIGFYWKIGLRFNKHSKSINHRTDAIWWPRIKYLDKINELKNNDEERDEYLIKYFDRYLEGYYNENKLSKTNSWNSEYLETDINSTLKRQRWKMRFYGYPMYWHC